MIVTEIKGEYLVCCDYCAEEFRGSADRYSDFEKELRAAGWKVCRARQRGEMVEHFCPDCWEEGSNGINWR